MRLFITIARKGKTFKCLVGPEVPFTEQRNAFRSLPKELADQYDEVQLCALVRKKRVKFKDPIVHTINEPAKDQKSDAVATDSVSSTKPTSKGAAAVKAAAKAAKAKADAAAKADEPTAPAGDSQPQSSLLD